MYTVKKLPELVDVVENHGTLKLGTKSSIPFASHGLDEESTNLFDFIRKEIRMYAMINEEFNKTPGLYYPELKGTLPLYGRTLDVFFQIMKGKTFPFVRKKFNKRIKGTAGCCEKCPDIEIQMEPVWGPSEEFDGIILRGELPNLVDGTDYKYFFDDQNLESTGTLP